MKLPAHSRHAGGYASFLMVVVLGSALLTLMIFAYKRAITDHSFQTSVQLKVDYREKEEAILRSIVTLTPNRAMRAMQDQSVANSSLSWSSIFNDALNLASARQSIDTAVANSISASKMVVANTGDSSLGDVTKVFRKSGSSGSGNLVSSGLNENLGEGYPLPLSCGNSTQIARDMLYPIISDDKVYGSQAQADVAYPVTNYPKFNTITYPNINFGYARPGQPFVAKRNWWAFSMDLAAHDAEALKNNPGAQSFSSSTKRDFVLSIYEIPSQLGISASSFMSLGSYASGNAWSNIQIEGGVFAGRAAVTGETSLNALATRRGVSLSSGSTIGGQKFTDDPMKPGLRETYQLTQGDFFPVSLASESGKAAFIPINRGPLEFLDRFAHTDADSSSTLSSTTWNNYTVGALQCAMRLDIVKVEDGKVSEVNFSYFKGGVRQTDSFDPRSISSTRPFESKTLMNTDGTVKKICLTVYPQRFKTYLNSIGANDTNTNHSLVINVDYTPLSGNINLPKPSIPCKESDYAVILQECKDLSSFTSGFSIVTNLRLYIADHFNIVKATTTPAGYSGDYYPPCSIFAAEKRYGMDVDPMAVNMYGQVGSLMKDDGSNSEANTSRPLEAKVATNNSSLASNQITANLRPITHPADLPPVSMMNWLILLEERKTELYTSK